MADGSRKRLWVWEERPTAIIDADGVRAEKLRSRRHVNGYAWDAWEQRAKTAGISADLASLGRAVMREADQHAWPEELQTECGWDDDGDTMIDLAIAAPEVVRARWSLLLETDGGYLDGVTREIT